MTCSLATIHPLQTDRRTDG